VQELRLEEYLGKLPPDKQEIQQRQTQDPYRDSMLKNIREYFSLFFYRHQTPPLIFSMQHQETGKFNQRT
jgi:hypothetical protein